MDLDAFTLDQLTVMSGQAADNAIAHYATATALVAASARIPYTDEDAFNRNQQQWRAAMAAGVEQEELCQAIGDEIRMRTVCDA